MEESFLLLLDTKLYFLPFEGGNLHSSARKLKNISQVASLLDIKICWLSDMVGSHLSGDGSLFNSL